VPTCRSIVSSRRAARRARIADAVGAVPAGVLGRRGIGVRRSLMETTEVDAGAGRRAYSTYVVRLSWDEGGAVTGVVVHVATGDRFAFKGLDGLGALLRERVSAEVEAAAPRHES
jgi:hypothetical protein